MRRRTPFQRAPFREGHLAHVGRVRQLHSIDTRGETRLQQLPDHALAHLREDEQGNRAVVQRRASLAAQVAIPDTPASIKLSLNAAKRGVQSGGAYLLNKDSTMADEIGSVNTAFTNKANTPSFKKLGSAGCVLTA